jgi:hypothetical protein
LIYDSAYVISLVKHNNPLGLAKCYSERDASGRSAVKMWLTEYEATLVYADLLRKDPEVYQSFKVVRVTVMCNDAYEGVES